MRPLGHRIFVKPDTQPDTSDSGLVLPQDRDHVPVSGTVISVGPGGDQMRFRARQRAIKDCCEAIEGVIQTFGHLSALIVAREHVAALLGTSEPEREIHVGDRVAYPMESGLRLTEDGEEYIILNEDDVAVIVEEGERAA